MKDKKLTHKLDWSILIIPAIVVLALCAAFMLWPARSDAILQAMRGFVGDTCGMFFSVLSLGFLACTLYIAFSKYGKIRLGNTDKPQYTNFQWCTMVFTGCWTADIIFYSTCEWAMYINEPQLQKMGGVQEWAPTYPLLHWGPTCWAIMLIVAIPFAFMLHVRSRDRQKFSEACRPVLGKKVDGPLGKVIDVFTVIALLAGTATSFAVTTPLLSQAMSRIFGLPMGAGLSIGILLLIAVIYTLAAWFGMKGVAKLAAIASGLFVFLLAYVLLLGGEARYILETAFSSCGNLFQNFISLSTWMDPLRENSFPQNWTIYYWAYNLAWTVPLPFFIASVSKGRSLKSMILGTYIVGFLGDLASFAVLGNYGLAQELRHGLDVSGFLANGGDVVQSVIMVMDTLPLPDLALGVMALTMIAFFCTTFDSMSMVVSAYTYKRLPVDEEPDRRVRVVWCIVLILFPLVLIFQENSFYSLQSVSIISAFPIGIIVIIMVASFFKDANSHLRELHGASKAARKLPEAKGTAINV